MITFYAQMYDATNSVYLDRQGKVYTIAEYYGKIDPETDPPMDVLFEKEGTVVTNIYASDLSYDYSNNIGCIFEKHAKNIYYETGIWPTLRLLRTSDVDDNYLEWRHGQPNGFTIRTDGYVERWESCFQWIDRALPRLNCIVFIKASNTQDLTSLDIHYSGGWVGPTPNDHDSSTLVGKVTGNFTCDLPKLRTSKVFMDQVYDDIGATYPDYLFYTDVVGGSIDYYYGTVLISNREAGGTWQVSNWVFLPNESYKELVKVWLKGSTYSGKWSSYVYNSTYNVWYDYFRNNTGSSVYSNLPFIVQEIEPVVTSNKIKTVSEGFNELATMLNFRLAATSDALYEYLIKNGVLPEIPDSDVDPDDVPPEDEPPTPTEPDDQDPYYDPTSDPESPDYDPTKDPESPDYDPTQPHTPHRPPSAPSEHPEQEEQPPVDPIPTPETPPSYVTTNAMFTLYNPSGGDLTNLANFLWSPTWSIDTFKKIFANPLDCILGLMVMPHLNAPVSTKTMNVGNISTGVTMHYFTSQFYDFDCGTFELMEYYNSYLDYAPYTKVDIFLPYIGDKQLSTDEVMNKTLGVKYRFDLATGDCIAFITVDGSTLYQFSGNCAARLPLAGNNWNGIIPALTGVAISAGSMAAGLPALGAASAAAVSTMKETISHTGSISGSAGLMGIQTPYLIVTRPRQALPIGQNSFTGYPSFITESLGSLRGYTEVEQCHLEHIPATGAELEEIERLLKEGVLF